MTRRLGPRLLAVVGAVVFAACAPAREYSLEEAPQSAYFLLFPSSQAKAYRSPDTRPGEELIDVRRAVTVSRDELRAGVLRFIVDATTDGYARVTDFSPLPQGDPVQEIAD